MIDSFLWKIVPYTRGRGIEIGEKSDHSEEWFRELHYVTSVED